MGKIRTLIRKYINIDNFAQDETHFFANIERVTKGLSVSFVDWPSRLPDWGKHIEWGGGSAKIPKKLKKKNEWFSIAVDFDGIINPYPPEKPFPHMGTPDPDVVEVINRLYIEGFCIIIWTVRGGRLIPPLKKYLDDNGILYHWVNENPEFEAKYHRDLSRKIAAGVYWDDRSVFFKKAPHIAYNLIHEIFENSEPVDPSHTDAGIDRTLKSLKEK